MTGRSGPRWPAENHTDLCASQEEGLCELRAALERLPSEYRRPLLMQVQLGYSTAEIARELHLSRPAVLTRRYRARMRLRDLCSDRDVRRFSTT
jgi:DNA-directed RNA polymerase specialized sigma24 family protein